MSKFKEDKPTFKKAKKVMARIVEERWLIADDMVGVGTIGQDDRMTVQVFVQGQPGCELPDILNGLRIGTCQLSNFQQPRPLQPAEFKKLKNLVLRFIDGQWQFPEDFCGVGIGCAGGNPCLMVFVRAGSKSRYSREFAGVAVCKYEICLQERPVSKAS